MRADKPVGDALWKRLFATRAWQALGETRREQARERYALAFRPSREAAYRAAIARGGYEARVLQHLRNMIGNEAKLRSFQRTAMPVVPAIRRAGEFLPPDGTSGPAPIVALAVYEPDGYGADIVVLDLAFAAGLGDGLQSFLAHEFHHVYQSRIARPLRRPPQDSVDALLLDTLLQLQREGIADLVDKRTIPVAADSGMRPDAAARFAERVGSAPASLESVDRHLQRIGTADASAKLALANEIRWKLLPGGGHAAGFHMARTIRNALGKERLLETLYDPFDFVRAYNSAIGPQPGGFSPESMTVLRELEQRVTIRLPSMRLPAAIPEGGPKG